MTRSSGALLKGGLFQGCSAKKEVWERIQKLYIISDYTIML